MPWPSYAFRQELETNRMAHYLVCPVGADLVAYGGLWLMVDEAHVTSFAVLPAWRRHGIGGRLMLELMDLAADLGARVATLEVRLSNEAARLLYQRFGFRPVGVRPRYYSDNGEDALIMTTDPLDSEQMRQRLAAMAERYGPRPDVPHARRYRYVSVRLLAIETSCDETSVAVVEDGRRIHANVVASQVALHAQTGGIVPEVAARAHLRWMMPGARGGVRACRRGRPADLDGIAVTEGPGLAGSLLVGITMARTLAWDTGLPLVPVNHLEGHIYAAWLLDPDEPDGRSRRSRWWRSWSAAATRSWSR